MTEVNNALTLGDDEEVLTFLQLLDKDVIGLVQLNLDVLDNRYKEEDFSLSDGLLREWVVDDELLGDLHDCGSYLEIILDDLDKNLNRHLLLNRRADQLHKIFLDILLILGALGRDKEHSNVSLGVVLQTKIIH